MVSYIHLPIIVICFFVLMFMRRWWLCVDRMGYTKEVGRRAPSLVQRDILAATFAIMPFALAAVDWFSIALPGQAAPIPSMLAAIMSLGCVGGVIFILKNTGDRFAGNWAGTRESALRTVAALRIIDAAELAHALDVAQQHEARHGSGRVIDAETREVRK